MSSAAPAPVPTPAVAVVVVPEGCPDPTIQSEFNDLMRFLSLFLFLFYSISYPLTCAWWWTRRREPWLRKRQFALVVVGGLGMWCEICVAGLGNFTGRRTFPCDAHLWLTFLIVPLGVGSVFARLTLVYFSARYSGFLLSEGVRAGARLDHVAFQREHSSLWSSAKAVMRFFLFTCGDVDELLRQSPRSASVETDSAGLGKGAGLGGARPEIARDKRERARAAELEAKSGAAGVAAAEAAARREVGSLEARREERRKTTVVALYLLTKPWHGIAITLCWTAVTLLVILAKAKLPGSTYGKGCAGCVVSVLDFLLLSLLLSAVVACILALLWKLRREPDPLGLLHEIQLTCACGVLIVAGTVLAMTDPAHVRRAGQFDWVLFCVVASIGVHTIACPLQVWRTYQPGAAEQPVSQQQAAALRAQQLERLHRHRQIEQQREQLARVQQTAARINISPPGQRPLHAIANTNTVTALAPLGEIGEHGLESARADAEDAVDDSVITDLAPEDVRLDNVLATREGRRIFKEYLASEYQVEIIYFLEAVDRFKAGHATLPPAGATAAANDIYGSFLKDGSLLQVSLSKRTRRLLLAKLGNPAQAEAVPGADLFDIAWAELYGMLVYDSFPRFLRSPFFKEWAMPGLRV
jgi:hypothetical protein